MLNYVLSNQFVLRGQLVYSFGDMAFDFHPEGELAKLVPGAVVGTTSLAGDAIELEVAVGDGRLLYAWGYSPVSSWVAATVSPERGTWSAKIPQHDSSCLSDRDFALRGPGGEPGSSLD